MFDQRGAEHDHETGAKRTAALRRTRRRVQATLHCTKWIACGCCGAAYRIGDELDPRRRYGFDCARCNAPVRFQLSALKWSFSPLDPPRRAAGVCPSRDASPDASRVTRLELPRRRHAAFAAAARFAA